MNDSLIFDLPALLKLPLALALVIGLILLAAALFRRFSPFAGAIPGRRAMKRLGVVSTQVLDNKRRLILIRRDGVEHLLLIGGTQDLLIETHISPPAGLSGSLTPGAAPAVEDPQNGRADPAHSPLVAKRQTADEDHASAEPPSSPLHRTEPTLRAFDAPADKGSQPSDAASHRSS